MSGRAPRLGWGFVVAGCYLAALVGTAPRPAPLLYDGLAPLPPYQWIHPPAQREKDNLLPKPGTGVLALGPQGSEATEVSTPDDQALVTFPTAIIGPRSGESSVKVTVTPLDAASIAPAPKGQSFDSNGYWVDAVYATSAQPVALTGPMTVVLRYAIHGTRVLRSQDRGWLALSTTRFDGTQQVLANSDRLGVFVAAMGGRGSRGVPGRPAGAPVAAGAGLIAAAAGWLRVRRRASGGFPSA